MPESDSFAKYIFFLFKMCFWSAFKQVDRTLKITLEKIKFLSKKLRNILKKEMGA